MPPDRRRLLQGAAGLGLLGALGPLAIAGNRPAVEAESVTALPKLAGKLTVYLGHGEGGLYEDVLAAIRKRNPALDLRVRRASSSALANTLIAEAQASEVRADVFWSVDAAALAVIAEQGLARTLPPDLRERIDPTFRYPGWAAISGRIRTLPYNPRRVKPEDIPEKIMDLPGSGLRVGWAPAYAAFQSFVAAMRLLEGERATRAWLRALKPRATAYAGELGVVLGVSRGEVDVGLANHYYSLRLKEGRPDAPVALAFTRNDAGCLVNASGAAVLTANDAATGFVRHLLTREAQTYLAEQAFEIPLARGVPAPAGLPSMRAVEPPRMDLNRLADLQPALRLMRETGVL